MAWYAQINLNDELPNLMADCGMRVPLFTSTPIPEGDGLVILHSKGKAIFIRRGYLADEIDAFQTDESGMVRVLKTAWLDVRIFPILVTDGWTPVVLYELQIGYELLMWNIDLFNLEQRAVWKYFPILGPTSPLPPVTHPGPYPFPDIFPRSGFPLSERVECIKRFGESAKAGIYVVHDNCKALYVGRTNCFGARLGATGHHVLPSIERDYPNAKLSTLDMEHFLQPPADRYTELQNLEYEAILKYKPTLNVSRPPYYFVPRKWDEWPSIPGPVDLSAAMRLYCSSTATGQR